MRAVVVEGRGEVAVREVPTPPFDSNHVLIRVESSGLCGTDHKIVEGHIPVAFPRVLGHEVVGRVVYGAFDEVTEGSRVLVDPSDWCGRCSLCRAGLEHLCRSGHLMGRDVDGGLADLVVAAPSRLHPIPACIAADDASILQVLGTCVHAQRLVQAFPTDAAVVIGLGVSGLLHVQLLAARGIPTVVGISRSAPKRAVALSLGASIVADPAGATAAVAEATGGLGAAVVVEAVGQETTLAQAITLVRPGGTVIVFGTLTGGSGALPYYDLYYNEVRLVSSRAARSRDYADAIALVASKAVQGAPLVTARLPLERAPDVFAHWGRDRQQLKVVLDV